MKTPIKYDKTFQKVCRILMIVTGGILLLFGILLLIDMQKAVDISDSMVVLLLAAYASIPLFPLSLVLYIDSVVYFKRLEKNHFMIPIRKKDYADDLSRLPRTGFVENCYTKDSKISAVLALIVYAVFVFCDLGYLNKWMDLVEDAFVMFCMLMLFHMMFLLLAFVLWSQRNTQKYVDEVDIRNGRKVRYSIMGTIGLLIVLSMVAAFSVSTADSMTKYVYRSRTAAESNRW